MTKPTKYQRWWMRAILEEREVTLGGLMREEYGQYVFKIHHRSFNNAIEKGWIEFNSEFASLTPAGRKAMEG